MRAVPRRSCIGFTVSLIVSLAAVGSASAYGPCGTNFDLHAACPISTSPTSVSGSVATRDESDYYVFYAHQNTQLALTLSDAENPSACGDYGEPTCSYVLAQLYNSNNHEVDFTHGLATVDNHVPQAQGINDTLPAGVYHVVVEGAPLGGFAIAYTLTIDPQTTPAVQWPPPCTVPRLHHDTGLRSAKRILAEHHCAVGAVTRQRAGRVRRGDVVGLRPRAGTVVPSGAKIHIVVSGTPRHHRGRGHR